MIPADTPPDIRAGDRLQLWVIKEGGGGRQVPAVVRRVSTDAIWVFDESLPVDLARLDASVAEYERRIWPGVNRLFPPADRRGLNGDHRITIFHTELDAGLAGYYSSSDEYPPVVHPFSNERKMIYIDSRKLAIGTETYHGVLAHELQHALHFSADRTEETWINEGLSELAVYLLGYPSQSHLAYLATPNSQLNVWPDDRNTGPSYGGALLFLQYLYEQYGGDSIIQALIAEPADGLPGVDRSLQRSGSSARAIGVFQDWVVTNFLDEAGTRYGYRGRSIAPIKEAPLSANTGVAGSSAQMSATYYEIRADGDRLTLKFEGDPSTALISAPARGALSCWWSNQGDSIDTTLTRAIDLTSASVATLSFTAWYQIEEEWDYAYVQVSADAGATWTILSGLHTTARNTHGNAFGSGYTGRSDGWVTERVDLSPFVGKRILLRIEYVTDDAVYLQGLCLDDFEISEIGWFDDAESDRDWQAGGFVRIRDRIPQQWLVQVIRERPGRAALVIPLQVGPSGTGQISIDGVGAGERIVVAVSALTPDSMVPARYSLSLAKGSARAGE